VGYALRGFDREAKVLRDLVSPVFDDRGLWQTIERVVDFDCGQAT